MKTEKARNEGRFATEPKEEEGPKEEGGFVLFTELLYNVPVTMVLYRFNTRMRRGAAL